MTLAPDLLDAALDAFTGHELRFALIECGDVLDVVCDDNSAPVVGTLVVGIPGPVDPSWSRPLAAVA